MVLARTCNTNVAADDHVRDGTHDRACHHQAGNTHKAHISWGAGKKVCADREVTNIRRPK